MEGMGVIASQLCNAEQVIYFLTFNMGLCYFPLLRDLCELNELTCTQHLEQSLVSPVATKYWILPAIDMNLNKG